MTQRRHPDRNDIRKKKRRRRRLMKRMLRVLCVLAVLTFVICLIYTVFQAKKINVKGCQYTASQDVVDWMKKDRFSDNSLYLYFKYNRDDIEQLPSVESVEVKLKSPWIVEVQVHEKEFVGGIGFGAKYLYFDVDGIASLITSEKMDGVPYIEGVDIAEEEVQLGKTIPVKDTWLYQQIKELSRCLAELELEPDKIVYEDSGITLHFKSNRVLIGDDVFEEKLQQIPPILEKLNEQYEEVTGTLHLENFEAGNTTIRFVPDQILDDEEDSKDEENNIYVDEYGNVYSDMYVDEYGNTYDMYGNVYGDTYGVYDNSYNDSYDTYGNTYEDTYDIYGNSYGYGDTYEDVYGYGY